jgi:hypothetical protein
MNGLLPEEFSEFEPFASIWCLETESERYERRMASSMSEMEAFYNAFFPRLEEAINYCDKFALGELPDDAVHLLQLIYSLVMVSMSVEVFHQVRTVNAADAVMQRTKDPRP